MKQFIFLLTTLAVISGRRLYIEALDESCVSSEVSNEILKGEPGRKGSHGDRGCRGARGPIGRTGADGKDGEKGEKGEMFKNIFFPARGAKVSEILFVQKNIITNT